MPTTKNLRLEQKDSRTVTIWLDVEGERYNALSAAVLDELDQILNELASSAAHRTVIIRSAKETGFGVGADVRSFMHIRTPEQAAALSARGQQVFQKLSDFPSTIAVVHGLCLGGCLELALSCRYRLIVNAPETQVGLPEIQLGLLPAWGGTQRLPRLIGIENALNLILPGKMVNAIEANNFGLADRWLPNGEVGRFLDSLGDRPSGDTPWRPRVRSWKQKLVESNSLGQGLIFRTSRKLLGRKVPDDMPAPHEALKAVEIGIKQGMEAGFAYEREAIGRLSQTRACRNLVTIFFMRENARKVEVSPGVDTPGSPIRIPSSPIKRVAVVGAGTMGAGIAQLAAIKGFDVVVQEVNEQALAAGVKKIEDLFNQAVKRNILSAEEARKKMAAVGRTTKWEGFANVDLVIEAVIEDLELKRKVFRELEQRCAATAVLATNTSSLMVKQIQEGLNRPERVAALHFFNPVHKMPLVEVVYGPKTDSRLAKVLAGWAAELGKTPVIVKDSPGFVVNRILIPYFAEAMTMGFEETVSIESIDHLMRRFGMPMGPFELLDQIGLDVALHIAESLRPFAGDRYKEPTAMAELCAAKQFGVKTDVGYYVYKGKGKRLNPKLAGYSVHSATEIHRDRLVLIMVNEAAACLGEGVAAEGSDIDLAMIFGTGWAPHRGGPLRYADDLGLPEVVKRLEELKGKFGARFEPCEELCRRAAKQQRFREE